MQFIRASLSKGTSCSGLREAFKLSAVSLGAHRHRMRRGIAISTRTGAVKLDAMELQKRWAWRIDNSLVHWQPESS